MLAAIHGSIRTNDTARLKSTGDSVLIVAGPSYVSPAISTEPCYLVLVIAANRSAYPWEAELEPLPPDRYNRPDPV